MITFFVNQPIDLSNNYKLVLVQTHFSQGIADLAYSSTQTDQPIRTERKKGEETERQRGRGSQLDRAVQQMRDDIPTQDEREGGNDGGERESDGEQRHLGHKGFLMEQNLHNLLR